jgi:glycosyltransferase involved in cell wall biosynthesis
VSISAVVITLNEEANIEGCLRSLSFADEIVVLDSFSTDRTVELARRYTDKVSCREFVGFSDQKNAAIELATGEWVFIVDADEVVPVGLAKEIAAAVQTDEFDSYRMPRSTDFLGRNMRHSGWYPDYQLRLARKSKAHIPDRLVHETLEVDGACGTLKNALIHYSYPDLNTYLRKMLLYTGSAARQKAREGRKASPLDLLLNPPMVFFKMYVIKQGFMDGLHGLVLSVLSACSAAIRYITLWELNRDKE